MANAEESMNGNPFVMDIKLDGERILVHIKDNEVHMFTRR
jgi:ATP-dependent DNA ligase